MCGVNITHLNAQAVSDEIIEDIKKRQLIVLLAETDNKTVQYLKEKDLESVDYYQSIINTYNENLKIAIKEFWPYHSEIQFVTLEDVKELKKTSKNEYVIIYQKTTYGSGGVYQFQTWKDRLISENTIEYHMLDINTQYLLQLSYLDEYGDKLIASAECNMYLPTKTEMAWMVNKLKLLQNDYALGFSGITKFANDQESNSLRNLKEMTLIVNVNNLDSTFSIDEIKKLYPYQISILDDKAIDELIYSKKEGYALLFGYPIFASAGQSYLYTITDFSKNSKITYNVLKPIRKLEYYSSFPFTAKNISEKTIEKLMDKIE